MPSQHISPAAAPETPFEIHHAEGPPEITVAPVPTEYTFPQRRILTVQSQGFQYILTVSFDLDLNSPDVCAMAAKIRQDPKINADFQEAVQAVITKFVNGDDHDSNGVFSGGNNGYAVHYARRPWSKCERILYSHKGLNDLIPSGGQIEFTLKITPGSRSSVSASTEPTFDQQMDILDHEPSPNLLEEPSNQDVPEVETPVDWSGILPVEDSYAEQLLPASSPAPASLEALASTNSE
ncbi:hypothetical protein HKX48_001604 [Thoreauomyces humboldtii]|nr:hypothetical protein HKX48_001604 [Thoreauomyces humboldtii]